MRRRGNFGALWRYEVGYQLRRPVTWVLFVAYAGLPLFMQFALSDNPRWINAPLTLASSIWTSTLFAILGTAALMGDAGTRDDATNLESLLFTAPIRKWEYLGGRFFGAFAVNLILLLMFPIGLAIAMVVPYPDPVTFGPHQWSAFVQPLLLVALPTTFVLATLLYTVAALTRRLLPMYVAAIGGGLLYLIAAMRISLISGQAVTAMMDPTGFIPIRMMIALWTPTERNTQLIGYPALLLWNRMLWVCVAAAALAFLHARFSFEQRALQGFDWFRRKRVTEPTDAVPAPADLEAAVRRRGSVQGRAWRQLLAISRRATADLLLSRLFLILAAGAVGVTIVFGSQVGSIVFETSTWPVTHLMAGEALTNPMWFMMSLLIALHAGELVWRDRDTSMSALTAAAPVPEWVSLAGRFMALVAMVLVLQFVMMLTGIGIQLAQGYYQIEFDLYFEMLFGLALASYLLLAVLAVALHVLIDHKVLGHTAIVLVLAFIVAARPLFGIRHHLLVYGSDPGWVYSDLSRYGPFIGPFLWFKLYWAGWAILLAVVAVLFWRRYGSASFSERRSLARERFRGPVVRAAATGLAIAVFTGGWIFYNTNVLNAFEAPTAGRHRQAEYERRYIKYAEIPQPTIVDADVRVELHPERSTADIAGTYTLVNHTTQPVTQVHVRVSREVNTHKLSFDREATLSNDDTELRYRIYALAAPLAPGDSLRLKFAVEFAPRGFPNSGIPTAVTQNGAYFDRRWMPVIGYQPSSELDDSTSRAEEGLTARSRTASIDDPEGLARRDELRDADRVQVRAVIGTAEDQIAVTSGRLVREWRENGRRYFEYRTDGPLPFGTPFLSARYAVREEKWHDVALRIYHHPAHVQNLDRMMRSMRVSLDVYTEAFGPYQFPELRIVEFPRYASFARAHPHTIAFSEGGAFLTKLEKWNVDRTFFVVAHETAHQWWGHQVSGARVEGAALLTESLAQYSAMLAMERDMGPEAIRRFYGFEMSYYLGGRGSNGRVERPMLQVGDQSHVYYRKGSVVMWTLKERLGAERVNAALRSFITKYRDVGPPFPTSLDLYRELEAQTPDSLRGLLHDLFKEVTVWDLRADSASADSLPDGRWRLTLDVTARKTYADTTGTDHEAPLDEWVQVGAFGEDGEDPVLNAVPGEVRYLGTHRIRSGAQRIVIIVPKRPLRAGIDPYLRYIDRATKDNMVTVRGAELP